ncbi:B12-binding domain-containing protein [Parasphingorhabdus sp.]|uniref:cobalamin B12-binding domain-containing protein n=1 Tax=Parasphingorhabdus sp. TaxID=2709688 RepID=UPI0035937582
MIQNLVIPKLIADRPEPGYRLVEQQRSPENSSQNSRAITAQDVEEFSQLSTRSDARELLDFVDRCLANGSSVDSIYVDLLAPTARRLGEYWESDERDFVDVTMGLWRIQEILRELTLRIPPPAVAGFGQRSALFSTMPGEQHSFGTLMIAECFYRAGWDADILIEPSQSELIGKFADRHYDLIGLTVSLDCPKAHLSSLVSAIRSVSSNPGTRIMMGGRVINDDPGLIEECGADATAADAPSAVKLAETLVPLKANIFESLI